MSGSRSGYPDGNFLEEHGVYTAQMSRIKKGLLGLGCVLAAVAVAGTVYRSYADRRDLLATPAPGELVDVGGHRLHIWCVGETKPGVPPVLFDSGLGGDAFDWPKIVPEIAKYTRVCTYDRAGMGYSDPGPMPRTSGQIAKELAALIENSEISEPAVLVGLSFGGFNIRIVASERPELVSGLVLVSTSHEDQGQRYAEAGLPSGKPPDLVLKLVPIAASLGLLRLGGITLGAPPDRAPVEVRPYVRATAYRTTRYLAMASELRHTQQSGQDVAAARRQLSVPLVVLSDAKGSGAGAEIKKELQADMATLSTRACQVVVEDSGHGLGDKPELVVQVIRGVLASIADSTKKPGC